MSESVVDVRRESVESGIARELIAVLNAELAAVYPEPGANHFRLDPEEVGPGRGAFLVVYADGRAVGCRAVRTAIALYSRTGYQAIEPWGEYVASGVTSVCMAKELA